MRPSIQLTGLHPRSEELIELTRKYDRGRTSQTEVEDCLKKETLQLVELQNHLGFEFVSDGALGWQDLLRPVARSLHGVEPGTQYSRWFDTNTFYLKPTVLDRVSLRSLRIDDFLQKALLPSSGKWKVSFPGPYTFSQLSDNKHYQSKSDLILDVAKAEREIAGKLFESGVSLVQLSEPCLVYRPYRQEPLSAQELDVAVAAIRYVTESAPEKFSLQTFFGDASPILGKLLEVPVAAVGIDLYETDYSTLEIQTAKDIILGIVDSEESHLEDPRRVAETALNATKHVGSSKTVLAPNSDLKFLPRFVADKKLSVLAEAARIFGESA